MHIIDAIQDANLFRPFPGADLTTWRPWMAAACVVYGLRVPPAGRRIVAQCTGRTPAKLPAAGFDTALFLTGRRCGKSRMAAVMGAFEAVLAGHETKLARGERGIVAVCAPSRDQSQVVKDYMRAVFEVPLLAAEVARETREGFDLANGTRIAILAGDWRTVRGYTLIAAIVDEAAFFGYEAESKIKSDTELIRALRPALATVGGKLIAITSPYARKGWTYKTYERNYGNDAGRVLVWNSASRVMNPTLPQAVVDDSLAEDMQAAKSEYLGEFRDDIGEFIPRSVVEALVVPGRRELLPQPGTHYTAFADLSGGRGDGAALAVAHVARPVVVIDLARHYRAPFDPHVVCRVMSEELKRYGIRRVTGDNYAADFVARAFEANGIRYLRAEKPKAQLYAELLPRLCSAAITLPDDDVLVSQLAALERRTRAGGRDVIDHPPGGHDDLANAVAGVAVVAAAPWHRVGGLFPAREVTNA